MRAMAAGMQRATEVLRWGTSLETWRLRCAMSLKASRARRVKARRVRMLKVALYVSICLACVIVVLIRVL